MKMGSLVGQTVKIVPTTLSSTQGKFAKVCVEIDFGKPLGATYLSYRTFLGGRVRRFAHDLLHLWGVWAPRY